MKTMQSAAVFCFQFSVCSFQFPALYLCERSMESRGLKRGAVGSAVLSGTSVSRIVVANGGGG